MALANQAKLTPMKHNTMIGDDDDTSISIDEYNPTDDNLKIRTKSTRTKSNKLISTSKNDKQQTIEPIQYGPITVKPRKTIAPTLANGRKSKDELVCIFKKKKKKTTMIMLLFFFFSFVFV